MFEGQRDSKLDEEKCNCVCYRVTVGKCKLNMCMYL